ncbi:MAG: PBS lyase HEAT-like repeat protein [Firmicutes bacterium ADurb.Bin419]|nr:MAG: PBS lyase HEAT-like repeat protein [Firmicutes bacterium ADurb.Bin419]
MKPLIKTLKTAKWSVRARTAEVIGKIGGEEALNALIGLLIGKTRDENRHVRGKAAEALGRIGDERALKALRNAQKDEFVFVKDKAEIAIHKILRKHETTRIFNFDNGEVSFDYSDHWEIISTSDAKKVVRGLYENNSITLSLNRNTNASEVSSHEFAEMLKDVFRVQGSKVIDENYYEKYGMGIYEIYGENHDVAPTSILIISFKKGNLLYYMWFVGDPTVFEDAGEDIKIMVDSFYIYD